MDDGKTKKPRKPDLEMCRGLPWLRKSRIGRAADLLAAPDLCGTLGVTMRSLVCISSDVLFVVPAYSRDPLSQGGQQRFRLIIRGHLLEAALTTSVDVVGISKRPCWPRARPSDQSQRRLVHAEARQCSKCLHAAEMQDPFGFDISRPFPNAVMIPHLHMS